MDSSFIPVPTGPPEIKDTMSMLVKAVLGTLSLLILLGLKCIYSSLKKAYVKHVKSGKYHLNPRRAKENPEMEAGTD